MANSTACPIKGIAITMITMEEVDLEVSCLWTGHLKTEGNRKERPDGDFQFKMGKTTTKGRKMVQLDMAPVYHISHKYLMQHQTNVPTSWNSRGVGSAHTLKA